MIKYLSTLSLAVLLLVIAAGCTKSAPNGSDGIDVDLTALSSTMAFAEVSNILTKPAAYLGKTIKMSGVYESEYWDVTGKDYHYVIITDATSCCPQGLEFIRDGEHSYPDDYPAKQAHIEVVGVYDSYDEQGQTYYYLAVSDVVLRVAGDEP